MNNVFIAFGGNIGNVKENFNKAIELLRERNIILQKFSKIYKSEPYGYKEQNYFYNAVGLFITDLDENQILNKLFEIENIFGRKRIIKNGPREIDLDIIFFNDKIINNKDLIIPHPEYHKRNFVVFPLCDINPDFEDPEKKIKIKEIKEKYKFEGEIFIDE